MKVYIETLRLLLRSWKETDLPIFIAMNQDERVMEFFMTRRTPENTTAFYQEICEELEKYNFGLFAVERKEEGDFIGFIGLHHLTYEVDFGPGVEIGWRLIAEAWGQGYATEGAKACLDYANEQMHLKEVFSFTTLTNIRSENVMKKIGMERVKEFGHPLVPVDHPLYPHVLYRISF
ncbi:GNAT family N-acetyltransferase [Chitinophaga flava]|uniref:GNAT family N-acetyltransferase n=1 Tax=Chitinophaga flava TaxID=2259036 RepID=A0A365XWV2_9BACT|nr:GNAT family N-acetyltransferase [Chitinophaga flava]RBL90836.1 GNAT family N-acetyltransferase [Chitinophaga flava]